MMKEDEEQRHTANEELISLSGELANRNSDLSRRCGELSNVLSAVNVAMIILEPGGTIRQFTSAAQTLFGLVPVDVGQPLADLRLEIDIPGLERIVSSVMETGSETSREIQRKGHWYSLRVQPLRTAGDKVDGAVIALFDIDELTKKEHALQDERNLLSAILDAAQDLLVVVLDPEGRIIQFNRTCQNLTGYALEEVKGRRVWDFLVVPEEVESVKAVFKEAVSGSPPNHENYWLTKTGDRCLISWKNSIVKSADGRIEYVIGTGTDQTMRAQAQATAQESAQTIHALLETAAQAIVAVTEQGRIVLANAATEKMFGYNRQELIGQSIEELIPKRLRQAHAVHRARWFLHPASRPMGSGLQLMGLRRDGTDFPIEVSLSYLHSSRHGALGVAFISDITERKKNEEIVLNYHKQLQRLAASLISDQENENRDLARELHDVFSQELAAVGMEVSSLMNSVPARSRLAPRLAELGRKVSRLAEEIHHTSRQLHPSILDELGLEAALREECEKLSQYSAMRVQFTSTQMPAALPQEVSLCLYRIGQESLHNIRKHSGATEVEVKLTGSPDGVFLQVMDSGDGFDVEQARKRGGLGLISMEERVRLVNGRFSIRSQPGTGTVVEVFIPLAKHR